MEEQMRVYEGVVQDRVVVLPKDVHLEEGLRVEVRVPGADKESLEALFKQRLLEAGLLQDSERPVPGIAPRHRTPIRVKGKPLSGQIIEERR
jgi:hypothetical protein